MDRNKVTESCETDRLRVRDRLSTLPPCYKELKDVQLFIDMRNMNFQSKWSILQGTECKKRETQRIYGR